MDDDMLGADVEVEAGKRATFDGRMQYYRIYLGINALLLKAVGNGDTTLWFDTLRMYYDHSEALFTEDERKEIDDAFNKCEDLIAGLNSFPARSTTYWIEKEKRRSKLRHELHSIHRLINRSLHAHGMLVPTSMGDKEMDIDDLLNKMGVSNSSDPKKAKK